MEQFLCLFQRVFLVQPCKNPIINLQQLLHLQRVNKKIQSRAWYQWNEGAHSLGRSASPVLSFNISFSPDTQQSPDKLDQLFWFKEHLLRACEVRIWTVSEGCMCPFVVAVRTVSPLKWQQNISTRIKAPLFAVPQVTHIDDFSIHQSDLLIQGSWKMRLKDKH